jgi:hypothetical protein
MEQVRNIFPHDQDNRIQKLYYDVNINTISNRTKLQNIKNKFIKYENYLIQYNKNVIQPEILRMQEICWDSKRRALTNDDGSENYIMFSREYNKCYIEICRYITLQTKYDENINVISTRIQYIKTHQNKVFKHCKNCSHCEKKDMVTNCGCKSKHKLCSGCIDDITECPVCEEDLGLQYCDICYGYKKELVDTGCENKHQTCKECLDKIIRKNNLCPFCRDYCSKEPVDPHPASFYLLDNGEDIRDVWEDRADNMWERRER